MANSFGGRPSFFGSYTPPKYSLGVAAPKKHGRGGILHNFVKDIETTATGIPMGLVMTVEHPIRMAEQTWKAEKLMYSPLAHGDFGKFYHQFRAHPLGPLLDAVSLATLAAGGLGAGLKAADLAAGGGKIASGLGEGESLSKLNSLANHFRSGTEHTTKELPTTLADHTEVHHYAANPVTRNLFQKPLERVLGVASHTPGTRGIFGTGGTFDYTDVGRGQRLLNQRASEHAAGTASAIQKQMWWHRKIFKGKDVTPQQIADFLKPQIWNSVRDHSLEATPEQVSKIIIHEAPEDAAKIHSDQLPLFDKPSRHTITENVAPKLKGIPRVTQEWGYLPDPKRLEQRIATPKDKSPEEMAKFLQSMGKELRTTDKSKAFQDPITGNYHLVHQSTIHSVNQEMDRSAQFMNKLYNAPTRMWKWLVLASAPRYLVNNMVGNAFMLAAAHDPLSVTKGILQAIHDTHGAKAAARAERKMGNHLDAAWIRAAGVRPLTAEGTPGQALDWQTKWYLGAHHGYVDDVEAMGRTNFGVATKRHLAHGLYTGTAKIAHTGPRRVAINIAISKHPIFRQLYREYRQPGFHGLLGDTTAFAKAADEASKNAAVRQFVEKESSNVMGQYHHFNSLEQKIRALVPFYSWDRHVMRWGKTMITQRPATTRAMLAVGQQGHDRIKRELGNIPSFLEGAIPLPGKAKHDGIIGRLESLTLGPQLPGRKKVLLTTGLNPPTSAADVLTSLSSLVSGNTQDAKDKLGSQLNPFLTGMAAGLTGKNLLTGATVKRGIPVPGTSHRFGGVIGTGFAQAFGTTPPLNLAQSLIRQRLQGHSGALQPKINIRTGKPGNPRLFAKDVHQEVASFLGASLRDMSPQAARHLYDTEEGIHETKSAIGNPFKVSTRNSKSSAFYSKPSSSRSHMPRLRKASLSSRSHTSGFSSLRIRSHKRNFLPKVTL